MEVSSAWGDHKGPVWAVITYSTYDCMRAAAGCLTLSASLTSVFRCLEAKNDRRDGALSIYLAVALAVAARSSIGVATGGV